MAPREDSDESPTEPPRTLDEDEGEDDSETEDESEPEPGPGRSPRPGRSGDDSGFGGEGGES